MLKTIGENVDILKVKGKDYQVLVEWRSVLNIIKQHVQRVIRTKCGLTFWKKHICKSEHKNRIHRFYACLVCKR